MDQTIDLLKVVPFIVATLGLVIVQILAWFGLTALTRGRPLRRVEGFGLKIEFNDEADPWDDDLERSARAVAHEIAKADDAAREHVRQSLPELWIRLDHLCDTVKRRSW